MGHVGALRAVLGAHLEEFAVKMDDQVRARAPSTWSMHASN